MEGEAPRFNINGRPFKMVKVWGQGCPLAPYLFLITGEVLNHMGIMLGNTSRILLHIIQVTPLFIVEGNP